MSNSRSVRTLLRAAAGHVARSLVRQAHAQVRSRSMQAEALEPRQLLSSSLITGADHVAVGSPYTLNLNALAQSNGSQWAIDWGDGSTVQNVATGQATATHTYAGASATRTITAGLTNGLANPLDRSFGNLGGGKTVVSTPGVDDKGFDVAVQSDGKLLVAGSTGLTVARFNADGSVDTAFGTNGRVTAAGGVGTGYGLVLQSDGKILVGGGENFALARFNADGTPDATFGTSGVVSSGFGSSYAGYDIAVVAGGKIVEVGTNGGTNFIAARFNANGSLDTTFGTGGKATLDFFGSLDKAFALAVQPDGKLLLGGQARDGATNYQWALARYNANGTLDTTFGTNGKVTTELGHTDDAIWDLQLQSDGKIVAAGRGGLSSSTGYDFAAARYTTGGVLDTTFGTNGMTKVDFGYGGDQAYALEVLPGDKLLLAGRAQSSSNAMNFGLLRLNANGSVDTTFGTAGKVSTDFAGSTDEEEATALLPDGAVILAGGRSTVNANGEMDVALAKYHLETSATLAVTVSDESLAGTGLQASVSFGPDGSMAVPGYRTDIGNSYGLRSNGYTLGWVNPSTGAPTLNANGTFKRNSVGDQRLDTGIGTNGVSWEMAVPNGTYYVKLVAGDPNVTSGTYGYDVEDVAGFLAGTATSGDGRWITATGTVTVTDGKLTIRNASGVTNHALAYVEITDDAARARNTVVAPASVVATASAGNTVDVRWTDKSDNETQFTIERATNSTGTWTTLGTTFANAGLFTDTTASSTTTYYYRVTALKGTAASTAIVSNAITTPVTSPGQIPYDPTRVPWTTQTPVQSEDFDSGGENVSYADNTAGNAGGSYRSGDEDVGYNIADDHYFVGWNKSGEWTEYTINVPTAGLYVLDASVASGGTGGKFAIAVNGTAKASNIQVPDTGSFNTYQQITSATFSLAAGTNQVVRLTATANDPTGYWVGDFDWIKLRLVGTVPAAAGGLTATATSSTSVALTWSDLSNDETGFRIERRPTGGTWAAIDSIAANATSYTDTGAAPRTAYEYRVVVFNAAGDGIASNVAAVTTRAAAPTGLNATPDTVGQKIDLNWTSLSGVDSIVIYRGTSATTLTHYDTAASGSTSYSDRAATNGQPYFYAIAAVAGSVEGDQSTVVSATLTASASSVRADLASDRISIDQPAALQLHSLGNPPLSINSWQIDWGDGTVQTVTGAAGIATTTDREWDVSHNYATTGTYAIHVTATEAANATHDAGTLSEAVLYPPPSVSSLLISPAVVGQPMTVSATAAAYQNHAGASLAFQWSFIDPTNPIVPIVLTTTTPQISFTPSHGGTWSVALAVTDPAATSPVTVQRSFVVNNGSLPLAISGPSSLIVGDKGSYFATGPLTDDLTWTVVQNGQTRATGSGENLQFTPSTSGHFQITVQVGGTSGTTQTATLDVLVTLLAPRFTISGPDTGFTGRALTFTAKPNDSSTKSGNVSYAWTLLNENGSTFHLPSGSATLNGLPTYVVPGSLAAGVYQVKLSTSLLTPNAPPPSVATFAFAVAQAPSSTSLTWGALPFEREGGLFGDGVNASAVAKAADGKLLVATTFGQGTPNDSYPMIRTEITRLNADLTVDPSFGPNHDGIVNFDAAALLGNTSSETTTAVNAAAIDPATDDLVVVGEAMTSTDYSQAGPRLLVAKFLTSPQFIGGHLLQSGSPDPRFNNGLPFLLHPSQYQTTVGYTLAFVPTGLPKAGDLIIGGAEAVPSDSATQNYVNGFDDGTYYKPPLVSDFLLVAITPTGQLDSAFGSGGVAQQPNVSNISVPNVSAADTSGGYSHGDQIAPEDGIRAIVFGADGEIIVGGTGQRLSHSIGTILSNNYGYLQYDTGFAISKYDLNGNLDTSFGQGGVTFTSSTAFGPAGTGAEFGNLETTPDGKLLAVGVAGAGVGHGGTSGSPAHVVLARYGSNGNLDSTFGSSGQTATGIIVTSVVDASTGRNFTIGAQDGEGMGELNMFGLRQTDRATFAFQNGKVVASVASAYNQGGDLTVDGDASNWQLVRFNVDATVDTTFGVGGSVTIPADQLAAEGRVNPGWQIQSPTILATPSGELISLANLFQNDAEDSFYWRYTTPVVVRYAAALPSVDNVVAAPETGGGVRLDWSETGLGDEGYEIRRATTSTGLTTNPEVIGFTGADQHEFVDDRANEDSTYYYLIVPLKSATNGSLLYGSASAPTSVHTYPLQQDNYRLQETLDLSSATQSASSSLQMVAGQTYLIVVRGSAAIGGDYRINAGHWYAGSDFRTNGTVLDGVTTGVTLATDGATSPDGVPTWGNEDLADGSYTLAYVSDGRSLHFGLSSPMFGPSGPGDHITIQIYSRAATTASSPPQVVSPAGGPALQIVIPGATADAAVPVLSARSVLSIRAAASDSSAVPWVLTLVAPSGGITTLAQGESAGGSLSAAFVIDPTRYAAGIYTLKLSTAFASPNQNYSTSTQLYLAPAVVKIVSPATTSIGIAPVVNENTPIEIVAAAPDGSNVPWSLSMVSNSGEVSLLASGSTSAGHLPGEPATVVTLDPALYENGSYTLRLTTLYTDGRLQSVANQNILIATSIKAGNLAFTASDGSIRTPIGTVEVTRSYDSYRDDRSGLLGTGWTFDLLDSKLEITSQSGGRGTADDTPVLRAGDLVTMTLPGSGRHVFEFDPLFASEAFSAGGALVGAMYQPRFIAIDGSGATLRVTGRADTTLDPQIDTVAYDALNNEFVSLQQQVPIQQWYPYMPSAQTDYFPSLIGFNPARPEMVSFIGDGAIPDPLHYQVSLPNGTSYFIDSNSGQITSTTDASGNSVNYDVEAAKMTATLQSSGQPLYTMLRDSTGRITEVDAAGQQPIKYTYDAAGNLSNAQGRPGAGVTYSYQVAGKPHDLTGVTNDAGQTVLQANYDPKTNRLASILNSDGVVIPVTVTELGTEDVAETVVDAAGNTTVSVYGERLGDLQRSIRAITDATTGATSYVVAVTDHSYVVDDVGTMSSSPNAGVVVLQSVSTYAPFIVSGSDADSRYLSASPSPDAWTKQVIFDTSNDVGDVAREQPISMSERIATSGSLITTLYSHYVAFGTGVLTVKPTVTQIELRTPDAASGSGYDDQVESTTYVGYDANGNQTYSVVAVARDVPGYPAVNPVLAGGYPTQIYVTLSGVSGGGGSQTLAWVQASGEYAWSDTANGDDVELHLVDSSLATRGAGATPEQGDAWSLRIKDTNALNGDGVTGSVTGLQFDGTPLSLQACVASLLDGGHLQNIATAAAINGNAGISIKVPGWIAQGTQNDYTTGGDEPSGLLSDTRSVTAVIDAVGTVEAPQVTGSATTQATYYTSNDYAIVNNQYVPLPGAAYGQAKYTFDAAGQETFYAYDLAGRAVLQYVYKTWAGPNGTPVRGWVGTTTVYDSAGRVTDTYQATYRDASAARPQAAGAVILPVIAGGVAGVQVDTSVCPVYAAPLRTQHTDYDALSRVADTIDQYGGQTTYTYDVHGNTIRVVNPDGTETRTVYDALNRAIWQTASFVPTAGTGANDDALTTHTVYDALGNAVRTEQYSGTVITILAATATASGRSSLTTAGTLISTSQTFYDPSGRAIEAISPTGLRTGTVYTPAGQVLFTGPLNAGAPDGGRSVTIGGVTSLAYLSSDFVSDSESDPPQYDGSFGLFYTRSVDRNGHQTKTYTDVGGRTVRTVYDDDSFAETLYSRDGTPVSIDEEGDALALPSLQIPAGGREDVHIAQRKSGDAPVLTVDLYDAAGRLADVWLPAVTDSDPNSPTYSPTHNDQLVAPHWTYAYDTAGNETAQVSPAEQAAYHQWLNAGSGWSYTQPTYDDETSEMLTSGTWAYTPPTGGFTAFGYDQSGNQVRQTLPDGEVQTWTYDSRDRLSTHTDFDGNVATYSYQDSGAQAGDLMGVTYVAPAGSGKATQTVGYTYDPLGRQQTVVDATGTTTSHYDVAGDLTESDTPEGTIFYDYDLSTGRHTGTRTANTSITYGYTPEDRLDTVTVTKLNGSTLATPLVTGYTYYANGDKHTETLPNGIVSTWSYDDLDRLTGLTETNGATTLFSQTYVLNNDGTRKTSHEVQRQPDGSNVTIDATWTYDADGRLTGEQQASSASGESFSDTFAYSLDNNRLKSVHVGPGVGANETITYAYNGDDELTGQTSSLHGTTTFAYDDNGSRVATDGSMSDSQMSYDVQGRLVSVMPDSNSESLYEYNDRGDIVAQTALGVRYVYLLDVHNLTGYDQRLEVYTQNQGGILRTYLLSNRIYGENSESGIGFLQEDGHGSTQAIAGSEGNVLAAYRYTATGGSINFDADTAQTNVLFGGDAIYDNAGKVYHHGNGIRQRSGPVFLERDVFAGSSSNPAGLNKYDYAQFNSVSGQDPSGYFLGFLLGAAGDAAEAAGDALASMSAESIADLSIQAMFSLANGIISGYTNEWFGGPQVDDFGNRVSASKLFTAGFVGGFTATAVSVAAGSVVGNAVGAGLTDGINDYLQTHHFGVAELKHSLVAAGVSAGLTALTAGLAGKVAESFEIPGQTFADAEITKVPGVSGGIAFQLTTWWFFQAVLKGIPDALVDLG